jgi:hypothetical protein
VGVVKNKYIDFVENNKVMSNILRPIEINPFGFLKLLNVLVLLSIPNLASTSENALSIKQNLKNLILEDFKRIQHDRGRWERTGFQTARHISDKQLEEAKLRESQYYDAIEKRITSLQTFIVTIPEEQLPDAMVTLFIDKPPLISSYRYLRSYIRSLGEQTILPIISKHYNKSDSQTRLRLLKLLDSIASRTALPLVKKAPDDPDLSVRLQSQELLSDIFRWLEYKPELKKMLIATQDSWRLKPTFPDFPLIGNYYWYETLFQLAKAGKISFYDLSLLGDIKDFPEDVIGKNLDFLIEIVSPNNENVSFFQQNLNKHNEQA